MQSKRAALIFAVCWSVTSIASAQITFPKVIAGPPFTAAPGAADNPVAAVRTDVDLVNPATATGALFGVHFFWTAGGCSDAVKIKLFRRSGDSLVFVTESAPLLASSDTLTTLNPQIAVQQGDLIGITRLTMDCGAPGVFAGTGSAGYLQYSGDVTTTVNVSDGTRFHDTLALSASGNATEVLAGVIPVVGATAGNFGAHFNTSLQLATGSPGPFAGRLVFHPAGVPGSSNDPQIVYDVPAASVLAFPNLLQNFGAQGLGSVDVLLPLTPVANSVLPVAVARIYNDAGSNGTAGATEGVVDPSGSTVIAAGSTALLVTPLEPARTRFNIGVRTLFSGATFTATLRNPDGTLAGATVTKHYGANFFAQVSATDFFGGTPIGANQAVVITVTDGSAIVYGATTDNVTNDPSIQYARVTQTP